MPTFPKRCSESNQTGFPEHVRFSSKATLKACQKPSARERLAPVPFLRTHPEEGFAGWACSCRRAFDAGRILERFSPGGCAVSTAQAENSLRSCKALTIKHVAAATRLAIFLTSGRLSSCGIALCFVYDFCIDIISSCNSFFRS